MNLKDFCDKVDQLTEFFTNIQTYINDIAEQRVTQFNQTALTTATLRKRMQTQTDETARSRQERIRERKLQVGPPTCSNSTAMLQHSALTLLGWMDD